MRVLFVSSGNNKEGISPIVKRQGESLIKEGIELQYFTIKGKGIRGYLSNFSGLKRLITQFQPNIIHSHYSSSAILATITKAKPMVVSLMGSDVKEKKWYKIVLWFFYKFFWSAIIVKSQDLKSTLGFKHLQVIPNGVNTKFFYSISKLEAQNKLNWDKSKTHILFAANPKRPEKNYLLASAAFKILNDTNIIIQTLTDVPSDEIQYLMNASDIILLTSLYEGSPNVIKEAMACNIPIVSTDVGDIKEVIEKTEGCYITSFNPEDVANKIKLALSFGKRTTGREDIQHLEASVIAKKIINVYNKVLDK